MLFGIHFSLEYTALWCNMTPESVIFTPGTFKYCAFLLFQNANGVIF